MVDTLKYRIILQQFRNKIYSYSYYILKNKMDAEDVTQETLLSLWQNIEGINFIALRTWVMKTTYNKSIDFIRKRTLMLHREELLEAEEDELSYSADENTRPDVMYDNKTMEKKIFNAINDLPDMQKHILILYEMQGLKYKEISKILELPINTIKVYIMRARKTLFKELKKEEMFYVRKMHQA